MKLIHNSSLVHQQHEDDEFIRLTLLVALHGLLFIYSSVMFLFFSNINRRILNLIERDATLIDIILSYPLAAFLFGFIVSTVIVIILEARLPLYYDRSLKEEYDYVKSSFVVEMEYEIEDQSDEVLEKIVASKLKRDLLRVYLSGIFAGFYSVLFYFLITFTIYIFLLMVFINFASPSLTAFFAGIISTTLTIMRISIVKTSLISRKTQDIDPHAEYLPTKRQIAILESDESPIICPACRSYISASSKMCMVCGEKLD